MENTSPLSILDQILAQLELQGCLNTLESEKTNSKEPPLKARVHPKKRKESKSTASSKVKSTKQNRKKSTVQKKRPNRPPSRRRRNADTPVGSTDQPSSSKSELNQKRKRRHKKTKATMLKTLRTFAANEVKIPKEGTRWARKMAETYLGLIRTYCKENVPEFFSHFEYTGSFYENLKVEDADELDIFIALDIKDNAYLIIEEIEGVPGYARIKATTKSSKYWKKTSGPVKKRTKGTPKPMEEFANGLGYIRPQKIRSWFFSVVQRAINKYKSTRREGDPIVKVFDNGPAIKLVIDDKTNDRKLSMDLVPAFLFKEKRHGAKHAEGKHYVAKILPKELAAKYTLPTGCKPEMLWRRSFSLDEKKKMQNLDKETKGCRREVIKIIKTIVHNDATLAKLSSFHVKTAFLHYNFEQRELQLDWSGEKLPERFFELLKYLRQCVRENQLRHFFIPELNLLGEIPLTALGNIDGRLTNLIENENEIRKVLNVNPAKRKDDDKDSQKPKRKKRKVE